jgi:hypothetical protein
VDDGGHAGTGGALTASVSRTIAITAVNDGPTATIAAASYAATEGMALDLAGTGLSIADVDAGTASVAATLAVGSGTLTITSGATGVLVSGSGTNTVTLTGSVAEINDLLAGHLGATVSHMVDGDAPPAADTLTLSVDDGGNVGAGGALTASVSRTIAITAVNDAPLVAAPNEILITVDQPTALLGISLADLDAGAGILTATVTVDRGALSALSGAGVSVGGSSSALMLSGTVNDLNRFLAAGSLTFTTAAGDVAAATLAVSVNDGGASGVGGGLSSATAMVTLSVLQVPAVPPPASVDDHVDAGGETSPDERLTLSEVVAELSSHPDVTPAPVLASVAEELADTTSSSSQTSAPEPASDSRGDTTRRAGAVIVATREQEASPHAGQQPAGSTGQGTNSSPGTRRSISGADSSGASSDGDTPGQRLLALLRIAFDQSKPAGAESAAARSADTLDRADFIDGLDRLRDGLQNDARFERAAVTSVAAVGTGLSVGYVAWLIRGGALLSSLVSSLPAWRMLDPFPVLARQKHGDPLDDDDESLESLVDRDAASPDDREAESGGLPAAPEAVAQDRQQSSHGAQS